jgi:hypothetical protein
MAISLVGTNSGAAANGGDVTIDLSGLGLAENDLVCVFGGSGVGGGGTAGVSTSGYTENTTDTTIDLSFSYKKMGASPDASVTCTGNANATSGVAYVVMAFRGVDTTTPIDATTVKDNGVTGAPNSASITTVTNGAAVISFGASTANDAVVTAPSGYGDLVSNTQSDTTSITVAGSWLLKASFGAENPAAYTNWTSSVWRAFTVALRPQASGSFGDGALSATGTGTASFEDGTLKVFAATGTITTSFTGAPFTDAAISASGSGAASFEGMSLATSGAFSISGTGTASFAGGLSGGGNIGATGTVTATFGGESIYASMAEFTASAAMVFVAADTDEFISHVSEVIESRGAVTVNIG